MGGTPISHRQKMPQASDSAKCESVACALNVKKSSSNMQNKDKMPQASDSAKRESVACALNVKKSSSKT